VFRIITTGNKNQNKQEKYMKILKFSLLAALLLPCTSIFAQENDDESTQGQEQTVDNSLNLRESHADAFGGFFAKKLLMLHVLKQAGIDDDTIVKIFKEKRAERKQKFEALLRKAGVTDEQIAAIHRVKNEMKAKLKGVKEKLMESKAQEEATAAPEATAGEGEEGAEQGS